MHPAPTESERGKCGGACASRWFTFSNPMWSFFAQMVSLFLVSTPDGLFVNLLTAMLGSPQSQQQHGHKVNRMLVLYR